MKPGVYSIRNIINNKIYIGSSKDVNDRKIHHFSDLRNNRHENSYLQNSFNKYGEEAFIFKIIEYNKYEIIIEREQYWMDYYNSYNKKKGYNLQPKAGRTTPWINKKHHTEEAKEKIRKSNTGKKRSEEARKKMSDSQKALYLKGYISPRKGKKDPCGKNSHSWKGGKPNCAICGVKLSTYKVKTCVLHRKEYKKRLENENINISMG